MLYTKGDWKLKRHHGVLRVAINGDKPEICDLIGGIEENAHLIAAAPDMYEALKQASEYCDLREIGAGGKTIQDIVDEALTKAEGK